ncbi:SH2 domain-containing protein A-like [Macadamia integrifolia]|uniref:SH2 domain-containing protein A-like n=1 Tax=Macadamia integrifolia TaxID=60698 RepID=UPI001C4E9B11|nr:SH2 domain-containing protein A-like [Macadamia integrifolia]
MTTKESVVHDDDYSLLKDLKLEIDTAESTFSLCLWIYLLSSNPVPATIIRQVNSDIEDDAPFLVLNEEKKMMLFPFSFLHNEAPNPGDSTSWIGVPSASSKIECPLDKWVHVGCEVSRDFVRLHINGVVVGEKPVSSALKNDSTSDDMKKVTLAGGEADGRFQNYIHYAQVLPLTSSVKDHFLKNPPLELSIDSSCASEIEEGGDGVWSVVGGKASCRRNFSLDVVLLDAFGHPMNKEMEVVASLLYADNGAPVEKPRDSEAPLLTSYDGIEYASYDRPSKLLHGRASFKLKISQLSSKCDNRLFRIRFDSPKSGRYPFFEAYSRPIRCISRNRNTRTSSLQLKKSISSAHLLDAPQSLGLDDGSPENQHNVGDGFFPVSTIRDPKFAPSPKRVKAGPEKSSVRVQADPILEPVYNSNVFTTNQGENAFGISLEEKHENPEGTDNTPSDSESVQARISAFKKVTISKNPISDLTVFKYCLGSINERALLLKEIVTSATDQEMGDFAQQVSLYTGCFHHRFQILIAKQLVQEGAQVWNSISQNSLQILWDNAILEIEEQFMRISRCRTRCLTEQDLELLKRIAGCRDYMTLENFEKMWHWLYPVAFLLSTDSINAMWMSTSPKWIEGLITQDEAESSLRGPRGLQGPGTFILRFPTSRCWPHPDAGSLVVTYVGANYTLHHRLLSIDYRDINKKPLQDLLLAEPELTRLGRVTRELTSHA